MASPADINNKNSEKEELAKSLEVTRSEAERPLSLEDFANVREMSPAMAELFKKLKTEDASSWRKILEEEWNKAGDEVVAMVMANREGPEIDQLLNFQEEINKILEPNGAVGGQEDVAQTVPGKIIIHDRLKKK